MAISLDTIKTGVRIKAPKLAVYGVGGVGKTTFAAGAPNPIFIFTEPGQGMLDVARFEIEDDEPVVKSWVQIIECVEGLYVNDHDYQTLVLDGLDFAEPLLWQYTCDKYEQPSIDAPTKEFGYNRGYGFALDEARALFQWLDLLRVKKNMAIVLLAHSHVKSFKSPEAESYDRYQMRLQDRFANFVHDWCDCVLFANYKTAVVKDDEGFNKKRKRGVGLGERLLHCEQRPAFVAKNRYGLPPEIDLTWAAFQNGIVVPPTPQPAATAATKEK